MTEYFFWPRKDAWEELKATLDTRGWVGVGGSGGGTLLQRAPKAAQRAWVGRSPGSLGWAGAPADAGAAALALEGERAGCSAPGSLRLHAASYPPPPPPPSSRMQLDWRAREGAAAQHHHRGHQLLAGQQLVMGCMLVATQ